MKFFHTADWHLGKLVQGVYLTDDQRHVLQQFIKSIEDEKPDAVIIAGDLYDRSVPPTEAVQLLDEVLTKIVLDLETPVLAISGNHDSPSRLDFGSGMMRAKGFHIAGKITKDLKPVVLNDEHGEVHFYLVPFADPIDVRHSFEDIDIRTHNDAMRKITEEINVKMDRNVRNVFVGHAFVTPNGNQQENTSDSERPLSIGGVEHVDSGHFADFQYTALGHLHQAHFVSNETIQYAGSPLKYSISEERHNKGFFIVELDAKGNMKIEKRLLTPLRDMRTVEGYMEDIIQHEINNDYVFVRLLDETPILSPMAKVRSVYPNAMHVERKIVTQTIEGEKTEEKTDRHKQDDLSLFKAFYQEVKGTAVSNEAESIFQEVLQELLIEEREQSQQVERELVTAK